MKIRTVDIDGTKLKLKAARIKTGSTVKMLADLLNRTEQSVYQWENLRNKRMPSVYEFVSLSGIYGINVEELLCIKEVVYPNADGSVSKLYVT